MENISDFQSICKNNSDFKIFDHEDKNVKYNFITDKETPWEYFIFSGEINNQRNEVIKSLLEEHYKSEDSVKMNENIKKIVKKYEKADNNYLLKKELSNLLNKNLFFFDSRKRILLLYLEDIKDAIEFLRKNEKYNFYLKN